MLSSLAKSGLVFLLATNLLAAQQAPHTKTKRRHHPRSAKTAQAAPVPTKVEVHNGAMTQTQVFDAEPPASRKSTPGATRVDVINGAQKQMQVFDTAPAAKPSKRGSKSGGQPAMASAEPVSGVDIFNGSTRERRVFDGTMEDVSGRASRQRVVVGITANGGESKRVGASQVVTGVAASGSAAGKEVQPVTVGVSPRPPKRPPYHPTPEQ